MKQGDLCLVTGVSGYLGSWLAHELLKDGMRVRGTVRNVDDTKKTDVVRGLLPGVELVSADLRKADGWQEAVAGCQWIFHVASPQAVPGETDRTGGAVSGTEYVMRAALAEASVQKIVVTSSEAAIAYGFPRSKKVFTEDDWTRVNGPAGRSDYFRSKTLAEQLAWTLAGHPQVNPRQVPLTTICPSFIAGPSLVPWGRYSLESIKGVADGGVPVLPDIVNRVVDVRDCARMHIALMSNPATNGHRHFSFGIETSQKTMLDAMRKHYGHLGYGKKTRIAGHWLIGTVGLFMGDAAAIASKVGVKTRYETLWPGVYQYQYTDFEAVLRASMESLFQHGALAGPDAN